MDVEFGWSSASAALAWASGFHSINSGPPNYTPYPYYNYGSCNGCPYTIPNGDSCSDLICYPENSWTVDDIWRIAYAGSAWPLPEIYEIHGVNAYQWQYISLYGANHYSKMIFKGAMTQYDACQTNDNCFEIDNSPDQGWEWLYQAINSDSQTSQDVQLNPIWSTDISWRK